MPAPQAALRFPPGWLSLYEHVSDQSLDPRAESLGRAVALGRCSMEVAGSILEGILQIRFGLPVRDWRDPDYVRRINGPLARLHSTMLRRADEIERCRERTARDIQDACRPLIERKNAPDDIMAAALRLVRERSRVVLAYDEVGRLAQPKPAGLFLEPQILDEDSVREILRDLWRQLYWRPSSRRHRR